MSSLELPHSPLRTAQRRSPSTPTQPRSDRRGLFPHTDITVHARTRIHTHARAHTRTHSVAQTHTRNRTQVADEETDQNPLREQLPADDDSESEGEESEGEVSELGGSA
jgi:hypothetical protein